jgi:hypothetical protein
VFNLSEYETVDSRIHQFYAEYKDGRIVTEMELIDMEKGLCIFKAYIYKDSVKTMPDATGYADGARKDRGVDAQFWINNAETSSIGRALANLGLSAKGKRPSFEEMKQVAPNHPALQVVPDAVPVDVDYWNTSFKEQAVIADIVNIQSPTETCDHGAMDWKTGEKNGKQWGGFMCPVKSQTGGTPSCPARWYVVSSSGKWEPQKARV